MNRKNFIKTTTLAGMGIAIFPHISFGSLQQTYTRDQLIGKGNQDFLGSGFKMEKETFGSFTKMKTEAARENINIQVVSAHRGFERQKQIFEGKYQKFTKEGLSPAKAINKIIEYSTIPGTSRHHWGTDIDIIDANAPQPNSVLEPENFHGKGPFCKLKDWLNEHSESFGFYEVYTNNGNRKGFKYEPWHFSYSPVSVPMLKAYREEINLKQMLSQEKIKGHAHFSDTFLSKYMNENILDINPKLL